MEPSESRTVHGIWIVRARVEDEDRIVAVCTSVEEAEAAVGDLSALLPELEYAYFPLGYRFGHSKQM